MKFFYDLKSKSKSSKMNEKLENFRNFWTNSFTVIVADFFQKQYLQNRKKILKTLKRIQKNQLIPFTRKILTNFQEFEIKIKIFKN